MFKVIYAFNFVEFMIIYRKLPLLYLIQNLAIVILIASAFAEFEYTPEMRMTNEVWRNIENPIPLAIEMMGIANKMRDEELREKEDENTYGFLRGYRPMPVKRIPPPRARRVNNYDEPRGPEVLPEEIVGGEGTINAQFNTPGLDDTNNPPEGLSAAWKTNYDFVHYLPAPNVWDFISDFNDFNMLDDLIRD